MKGKLIVIEGTDGTGKETQTKLLGKALRSEGIDQVCFLSRSSKPHMPLFVHGNFHSVPCTVTMEIRLEHRS